MIYLEGKRLLFSEYLKVVPTITIINIIYDAYRFGRVCFVTKLQDSNSS